MSMNSCGYHLSDKHRSECFQAYYSFHRHHIGSAPHSVCSLTIILPFSRLYEILATIRRCRHPSMSPESPEMHLSPTLVIGYHLICIPIAHVAPTLLWSTVACPQWHVYLLALPKINNVWLTLLTKLPFRSCNTSSNITSSSSTSMTHEWSFPSSRSHTIRFTLSSCRVQPPSTTANKLTNNQVQIFAPHATSTSAIQYINHLMTVFSHEVSITLSCF